jgi:hypothetical protein
MSAFQKVNAYIGFMSKSMLGVHAQALCSCHVCVYFRVLVLAHVHSLHPCPICPCMESTSMSAPLRYLLQYSLFQSSQQNQPNTRLEPSGFQKATIYFNILSDAKKQSVLRTPHFELYLTTSFANL